MASPEKSKPKFGTAKGKVQPDAFPEDEACVLLNVKRDTLAYYEKKAKDMAMTLDEAINDTLLQYIRKFTLKIMIPLMPSLRSAAESYAMKEGVSLNTFINVAVAEKLAHLRHEQWLQHRPKATPELIAKALAILDRGRQETLPGDELPEGYVPISDRKKKPSRKEGKA
jgi:hypothetical protein